jgi:GDP-L-fucose synthase
VNVRSSTEVTIARLVQIEKNDVGYKSVIVHDTTKPDDIPRKLLDSHLLRFTGWQLRISVEECVRLTYQTFFKEVIEGKSGCSGWLILGSNFPQLTVGAIRGM